MRKRIIYPILWVIGWAIATPLHSQTTASYTALHQDLQEGIGLFDQGMYGASQPFFQKVVSNAPFVAAPTFAAMRSKAQLYFAKAAVRLGKPEAESLVLDFVEKHQPDPIAVEAQMEIAHYYYNEQNFEDAIKYYDMIDPSLLTNDQQAETQFKKGYSYFVLKEFETAGNIFSQTKDLKTPYYYPTNYYFGLTKFFESDYTSALNSFQRVEKSEKYARYIPYYISQIQFAEKNYAEVISYSVGKLNQPQLHNKKEIHKMVGASYFELNKYEEALPHLSYYEQHSGTMRAEDFYQLGFVQYKMGQCEEAVKNFQELRNLDDQLGLQSHVYMADCYIKSGDLTSARTAFKKVSSEAKNETLKNEAIFNYAKLSAELNYDQEAIDAFQTLPPASVDYQRGQEYLKDIFLQTRDFQNALEKLEAMPSLSPTLQEAYQKVSLSRAVQHLNDAKIEEAKLLLDKSTKYTPNKSLHAQSLFWKGELYHFAGDYDRSIKAYADFFSLSNGINNLPKETHPALGHYNQGYNYLKKKQYASASKEFDQSIQSVKNSPSMRTDQYIQNRLMADAFLRNGDMHFKQNKYNNALENYNASIDSRKKGFVYAMYQKAIIHGLEGRSFEKIALLQEIIRNHKNDVFADDALLQLGLTYQEKTESAPAIQAFTKLIAEYDKDPAMVNEALLQLGLISYNNGDVQSALKYYKQIFDRNADPKTTQEALTAIEEIYIRDLGQPDDYVNFIENKSVYNVTDYKKDSLTFLAANTKYENANYEIAIDNFSNYLTKYPNGAHKLEAHYHRGESYGVQDNYTAALKDFEKVIDFGQSNYYEKALKKASLLTYNHTQNFDRALQHYVQWEAIASNEEDRFEAQLGAMRSAYRIHDQTKVIDQSTKVINNAAASIQQIATAHFYRGKTQYDRQDYTMSLADFNQTSKLSNNEQTAEARYLIATIYFKNAEYDIAEQLCLNVNKESSNYPHWVVKSVLLLSDIYTATGDYFNARAALEAVIENYDGDDIQITNEAKQKLMTLDQLEKETSRLNKTPANSNQLQMIENKEGNEK